MVRALIKPRRSVFSRAFLAVVANPAGSGGSALMGLMATAIIVNALALQPGRHPAPLFAGMRSSSPTKSPDAAMDDLVARTTGVPRPAGDVLVADIQRGLKIAGFYDGEVDGIKGPKTSAAISAFEAAADLPITGEPSPSILTALRNPPPKPQASTEAPLTVAGNDIPLPVPSPLRHKTVSDPVATAAIPEVPVKVALVKVQPVRLEPTEAPPVTPVKVDTSATPPADPRLARVQRALDLLGYGPINSDGYMSEKTRQSIKRFEENRGLPVTGQINERFLAELIKIGGLEAQ